METQLQHNIENYSRKARSLDTISYRKFDYGDTQSVIELF